MPRTETVPVVRLTDYRPSDWLIDTVALDVSLHPTATRVRASLSLRPNPDGSLARPSSSTATNSSRRPCSSTASRCRRAPRRCRRRG